MTRSFYEQWHSDIAGTQEDVGYYCDKCGNAIDEDTAMASELCADCCAGEAGKRLDREDAIKAHVRAMLLKLPRRA